MEAPLPMLLVLFLSTAVLVWSTTFGFVVLLLLVLPLRLRRAASDPPAPEPEIAIVIPCLNEAPRILAKLENLEQSSYPLDRMSVVVVDGRSTDGTVEIATGAKTRLGNVACLRVGNATCKMDQVRAAVEGLPRQIVVVTDADSLLEPECIRNLVTALTRDPETAIVGACVHPDTPLLEERLHWWLVNHLWWLDGEVLSAAGVSGVCYAVRREMLPELLPETRAEDIRLALDCASQGGRVRICRRAHAFEQRVPRTLAEALQFRRRRGAAYLDELQRRPLAVSRNLGWRIARFRRWWNFRVTPLAVVALLASGGLLVGRSLWAWPLGVSAVFLASAIPVLFAAWFSINHRPSILATARAAVRISALSLFALLTLRRGRGVLGPVGGGA